MQLKKIKTGHAKIHSATGLGHHSKVDISATLLLNGSKERMLQIIASSHPIWLGFPCGSAGTDSACNAGDLGLIPVWGRSPGERKGYPLQYSGPENSTDCIVQGVAKSRTRFSDFDFDYTVSNYFVQ